jgi:tight adherence protein C
MTATMLLLLGGGLLFLAGVLALSLIGVVTAERRSTAQTLAAIRAIDSAPEPLRKDVEESFAERVLAPLGGELVGLGKMLTRADAAEKIQRRLDHAGNPPAWDVNRIIGLKVLGLASVGGLSLLYLSLTGQPLLRVLLIGGGLAAFGFFLPNILLRNAGQKREEQMLRSLPDALDLLTISVEAGLAFDSAVGRVARNTKGPLAQEFARLLQEMQIGVGRAEAMRAMAERTTLKDLRSFCLAMVQADTLGVPVARVLRVQSKDMRIRRRQRAEEKAQKLPVKILFPLVFFILPSLFIIIIGPVALSLLQSFRDFGGMP